MAQRYNQCQFITYPESMGDIYSRIENLGIQAVRSPLHDSDVDIETGEKKKAHYHNMLLFSSGKSADQIDNICSALGVNHWEQVLDRRASLRYYCHLDVSDGSGKCKYSVSDVRTFGGFNYSVCLDAEERQSPYVDVLRFIRELNVTDFRQLVDDVLEKKPSYIQYLVDKAYFFRSYVQPRDQN